MKNGRKIESIKKSMIAGVTVLYNPDGQVAANIQTYIHQIHHLFRVDNSENGNHFLIESLKKRACKNFTYIENNANLGIAKALNIGAQKALNKGYSYLLMMDQDSRSSPTMIQDLIQPDSLINYERLGILSPFISIPVDPMPPENKTVEKKLTAWTSGSLLNLSAYREIGPFLDEMFIDFVDHEYCLRLSEYGFNIYRIYSSILKHEIGINVKENCFLTLKFITSNHSALRKYYITRNRFFVAQRYKKKFPAFFWDDRKKMIADFINIFLFEQDKLSKFRMIFRGYRDYRKNKMGKYFS